MAGFVTALGPAWMKLSAPPVVVTPGTGWLASAESADWSACRAEDY